MVVESAARGLADAKPKSLKESVLDLQPAEHSFEANLSEPE